MISGTHIKTVQKRAHNILGIMRKLKYSFSRKALNQMYVSHVRHLLEYSSIVWGECTEKDQTAFERFQNEAARIVTSLTQSTSIITYRNNVVGTHLQIRDIFRKCGSCISVQITLYQPIYLILFHHVLLKSQITHYAIQTIFQIYTTAQKLPADLAFRFL